MALAHLILTGTVNDISSRQVTNERGSWNIHTAYLSSARRVYEVTITEEMLPAVVVGSSSIFEVYPRVYNGNVTFAATELLTPSDVEDVLAGDVSAARGA